MNTVFRISILFLTVTTLAVSSLSYGQSYNRAVVLRNPEADTIGLYPPASGLTSYHLTLPTQPPLFGSLWYAADGIGGLGWIAPGNNNDIFQIVSGTPSWQNPNSALDDNFVRYNIGTTQSLATTTGGNYLFNIEYGTTNAASASGARINSLTTLANSNATGLTLHSQANGTGTSRGLVVTTSGGTSNYAATFNGGNVGIGTVLPTASFDIDKGTVTSTSSTPFSTWALGMAEKVTKVVDPTGATSPGYHTLIGFDSVEVIGSANMTNAIVHGRFLRLRNLNSTGLNELRGYQSNMLHNGTGNLTLSRSFLAYNAHNSSSTLQYGIGYESLIDHTGSGLYDTAAGFRIGAQVQNTGSIGDLYGLWVGPFQRLSSGLISNLTGVHVQDIPTSIVPGTRRAYFYDATYPNEPFVVLGSGNVGIGVSNPEPRLHVQADTVRATSSTFGGTWFPHISIRSLQYVNPASPPAGSFFTTGVANETRIIGSTDMSNTEILGTFALNRNENTNTVHSMRTIQANLNQAATGTVDTGVSIFSDAILSGSGNIGRLSNFRGLMNTLTTSGTGTITTAVNLDLQGIIRSSGNITNLYGLFFESPSREAGSTGTFTNVTGLYIKDIPSTAYLTGTRRAFYYEGSGGNDPVVITGDGRVGIGDNSTTPLTSFDVDGGVVIRPPATVTVSAAGNISVGNVSYLRLNPTGGAGVNVGLAAGNTSGHILIVEVLDNAANTLTFVDNVAQNLNLDGGNYTPANSATLTFIWNGTIWMELARRTNN